MGATGTGKTFTMARIIAVVKKPTLVIAHNKTLAAQLYEEFKEFFPHNAVGYFVSYYDYYQPEAYIPQAGHLHREGLVVATTTWTRLRLAATTSNLVSRATCCWSRRVSCIFGLGSPDEYPERVLPIRKGGEHPRPRPDAEEADRAPEPAVTTRGFKRGTLPRGAATCVELHPANEESALPDRVLRRRDQAIIALQPAHRRDPTRSRTTLFDLPGDPLRDPEADARGAVGDIRARARGPGHGCRVGGQAARGAAAPGAHRVRPRDAAGAGVCPGIENYSRHLDGRKPGEQPFTLIDYFPKDFVILRRRVARDAAADQGGMYNGDRAEADARRPTASGCRGAMDNRPLKYEEFLSGGGTRWSSSRRRRGRSSWRARPRGRRAGDPPDRAGRPADRACAPAKGQVPHLLERDQEAGVRRASACSSRR